MRTPKSRKFAVEQADIQNKIIGLLNLEGNGFYLYDLDRNKDLQKQIMDMVPDIWKCFPHVNITGLIYPDKCKRPWLSIVRGVIKNRFTLKYKSCRYQTNGGSTHTMRYFLERKTVTTPQTTISDEDVIVDANGQSITNNLGNLTKPASSSASSDQGVDKISLQIRKKSVDETSLTASPMPVLASPTLTKVEEEPVVEAVAAK